MSIRFSKKVHWKTNKCATACGLRLNGISMRRTDLWKDDVTCENCKKAIKNVHVCPNCSEVFRD